MPRRICASMDDHCWVADGPCSETYCMDCGLKPEDAIEEHSMMELDEEDDSP